MTKEKSLKLQYKFWKFNTVVFTVFAVLYSAGLMMAQILPNFSESYYSWMKESPVFGSIYAFPYTGDEETFLMTYAMIITPLVFLLFIYFLILHFINGKRAVISVYSVIASFVLVIDIFVIDNFCCNKFYSFFNCDGRFAITIIIRYILLSALLIYNTLKYKKAVKAAE